MTDALWIFLAGGLGCLARYGASVWVQRASGSVFPYGTLAVNALGCLLIGFLFQIATTTELIPRTARVALTTGFLGGFTTYSTFGYETFKLIEDGAWAAAFANVGAELALGLAAVWAGTAAARAWTGG